LLIGGATTSKLHTALKIAPQYGGTTVHVKDASQNITILAQLLNPQTRAAFITHTQQEYNVLCSQHIATQPVTPFHEANRRKPPLF
jgi:5-methyltetrahydrofolate--homocysteine methyltransferase